MSKSDVKIKIGLEDAELFQAILKNENLLKKFAENQGKNFADVEKSAKAALKQIETALNRAGKEADDLDKSIQKSSNHGSFALMSLARVGQDLPYALKGNFGAVANNLEQVVFSMGLLAQSSKETGGLMKTLAGTIMGPTGVLFALSLIPSAILIWDDFRSKVQKTADAMEKLREESFKISDKTGGVFFTKEQATELVRFMDEYEAKQQKTLSLMTDIGVQREKGLMNPEVAGKMMFLLDQQLVGDKEKYEIATKYKDVINEVVEGKKRELEVEEELLILGGKRLLLEAKKNGVDVSDYDLGIAKYPDTFTPKFRRGKIETVTNYHTNAVLDEYARKATEAEDEKLERAKEIRSVLESAGDSFAGAMSRALWAGESLADTLKDAGRMFAQMLTQKLIMKGVDAVLKLAGLASGGDMYAGRPYMVGEQGPELVLPKNNGMVVSNNQLQAAMNSIGGGLDYDRLALSLASALPNNFVIDRSTLSEYTGQSNNYRSRLVGNL